MPHDSFFNFFFVRMDTMAFFLGARKHLYNWSVGRLVGRVTHSFDDPYVAPKLGLPGLILVLKTNYLHHVLSSLRLFDMLWSSIVYIITYGSYACVF